MSQQDCSRVERMSEKELVRWSVIMSHMAAIFAGLTDLEEDIGGAGKRAPDTALAEVQEALKVELDKRTAAKRPG